jgi:hypothetical protein
MNNYALFNKQTGAALGFTKAPTAKDAVRTFVDMFGRDLGLNWRNIRAERTA